MNVDEIKQKLIENSLDMYIPIFEEQKLFDENVLSSMTNDDYLSIGISQLGDRKKLLLIFGANNSETESEVVEEEKDEFEDVIRNGKEFCIKESEPGKVYCRKCHNQVSEDDTLCSHCNNSLIPQSNDTPIVRPSYYEESSNNNSSYIVPQKKKSPIKTIIILIILGVVGFFAYKYFSNNNYSSKFENIYDKILDSASEVEYAGGLVHDVWANAINEKSDPDTNKYTRYGSYSYYDFNTALNNLYSDSDFKKKISKINNDSENIRQLMKSMMNAPADYKEAYMKLNSCYETYNEFVLLVENPSGSLLTYTRDFNRLDSAISSSLKSLSLYLEY